MSSDVEKVMNIVVDDDLCSKLFDFMLKHYGERLRVSECKEKDQVVILVCHASGIIENGGFQYLFEGNFKGDPDFARTAAAYRTIKATKCADAFMQALALFPGSRPPIDVEKRLNLYQNGLHHQAARY